MKGTGTRIVALLAVAALIGAGCATTGQSTGLGAGLGAFAGAALGIATGQDAGTTAAMAAGGAAIGAAVGYGIHKKRAKKIASTQDAQREYEYTAQEGLKLDMRKADVTPDVASPGGTVSATMQYAALGSGSAAKPELTERFTLIPPETAPENDPIVLSEDVVPLEDGIWESGLDVTLPKDVVPGEYTLAQEIEADGKTTLQRSTFMVTSNTAAAR